MRDEGNHHRGVQERRWPQSQDGFQVAKTYDGFGQEIDDGQEHDGEVDESTPKVVYGYADGLSGNTARRESITYPNGRQVDLGYGAADSIEDLFSLVKSVAIQGETGDKVACTRIGLGRFFEIAYPQPGVRMSMLRPGGGSEGDAGDPYDGFDRFSRTQAMRRENTSDGSVLAGWNWGFNEASNRTWKKNRVAAEADANPSWWVKRSRLVNRESRGEPFKAEPKKGHWSQEGVE